MHPDTIWNDYYRLTLQTVPRTLSLPVHTDHKETSEYLKEYAPGDIIVQAETVDEARSKILADFDAHLEWHRQDIWDDHVGTYGEPDSTGYREQLSRLRDDISGPPEVIHRVLWMNGSS